MKQNEQLTELSHRLGDLIHNWGFKRIHGRIWTRLFLSTRPLDAADLIQQLDISKALVSISLRELLELKAVEEVGRSARGTNLYKASGDLQAIYLELLRRRERMMIEQTSAALSLVSNLDAVALSESDISPTQIEALESYLKMASAKVEDTLKSAGVALEPVVIPKPAATEIVADYKMDARNEAAADDAESDSEAESSYSSPSKTSFLAAR